MKTVKTKQERYDEKIKLAKRLGLEVVELTPWIDYVGKKQYHVDRQYLKRPDSFPAVVVPYCYLSTSGELFLEVNYRVLEDMKLRHIIFTGSSAYLPLSLLKPDRHNSGIASAENDAIHTILVHYHLNEDEYYHREMEIINEEIPSMMRDLWDEITSAHPDKATELLAQYESRSYLIEDMISHCSDIFERSGNYPYLDGGEYPYLDTDSRTIQAAIDVISGL